MKVKQLLEFLKEETQRDKELLNKEVTFYDYKTHVAHDTPSIVTYVDLSDEKYLDFVFNYDENKHNDTSKNVELERIVNKLCNNESEV